MQRKKLSVSTTHIILFSFLGAILVGAVLLCLPISSADGNATPFIDALFTATTSTCVTGLVVAPTFSAWSYFGQAVILFLIQIGGLGVTSVGAGVIMAMNKRLDLKSRLLIREGSNLGSAKGIALFIKNVFVLTLIFELIGAALSFIVFSQDYPILDAIGISLFHSVAAFNNSGFDILGNFQSLIPYQSNVLLNLVTCALIFFGGIGFLVIREIIDKRFNLKKCSMHTKVVLSVSAILLIVGTLLIKLTEDISWLGAFFTSVSVRTAGFSAYSLGGFSNAGLLIVIILMIIGASPGSTGGGIKTSTFFVLVMGIKSAATNKSEKAFKYSIPKDAFKKAATIFTLAISIIALGTYLLLALEPNIRFIDALFEITSAFGTVGLSTGITTSLCDLSKLLSIIIMFIGRLGPLTVATLWYFSKGERVRYPDGDIAIG
jgi:trk system potassium uptake protein TrkH